MKKALPVLLALFLALSLCACSAGELLGGIFGGILGGKGKKQDSAAENYCLSNGISYTVK